MLAEDYYQWSGKATAKKGQGAESTAQVVQGENLSQIVLAAYDVADDDRRMREAISNLSSGKQPAGRQPDSVAEVFDRLRRDYPQRHEFTHFSAEVPSSISDQARLLGFI